jgi:hypothetical protein
MRIIAVIYSLDYKEEERKIQNLLKSYHFDLEWFELPDEQYQLLFDNFQFQDYLSKERKIPIPALIQKEKFTPNEIYHVFKKSKILKNGSRVRRWYYYYYDQDGKQVQKACRGCRNRIEAENYVRNMDNIEKPVPSKEYHLFRKTKILKNGSRVHRWYYYWIDETGKQYQKTCGRGVKSRWEAENIIKNLEKKVQ